MTQYIKRSQNPLADYEVHFKIIDQGVIDHVLSFKPRPPKGEATFKNGRSRPSVFFGDTTDLFGEWVSFEQLDAHLTAKEANDASNGGAA